MFAKILVLMVIAAVAVAQIPCDDAYGQFCPEASGYEVGECLKKLESGQLSSECSTYISIHDSCRADIDQHCAGKEYTGDLLVCISEWTNQDLLSEGCKNAVPKKEVKEKKKLTNEEKKKADKRRQIRNKAAKMAREL